MSEGYGPSAMEINQGDGKDGSISLKEDWVALKDLRVSY